MDVYLLLAVQSACNANGVKLPWDKVASIMGTKFTEGAIVQHLSKLRARRDADNKPVPPPLRRSAVAGSGKQATGKDNKKRKAGDLDENSSDDGLFVSQDDEGDPDYSATTTPKRTPKKVKTAATKAAKPKGAPALKSKAIKGIDSDEEDDDVLCAGANFLRLHEQKADGTRSEISTPEEPDDYLPPSTQKSKIVRLKVPRDALLKYSPRHGLRRTISPDTRPVSQPITQPMGMVSNFDTGNDTYSTYPSPPAWNTEPAIAQTPTGTESQYPQQDDDFMRFVDPALFTTQPDFSGQAGWTSTASFAPTYPATYPAQDSGFAAPHWDGQYTGLPGEWSYDPNPVEENTEFH